jgi:hypothetical protein
MAAGFGSECGLAGEVTIKPAMRQTCRAGDIGNGHAADPVLAEQASGMAQDGSTVLCHGLSAHSHLFMISIMNNDYKPAGRIQSGERSIVATVLFSAGDVFNKPATPR